MLNIALIGANGRMGIELIKLINSNEELNLTHVIVSKLEKLDQNILNKDVVAATSLSCLDNNQGLKPDVVIDFSNSEATLNALIYCKKYKLPILVGTTGFTPTEQMQISLYKKQIPILIAPNTSLAACLLFRLTEIAAAKLIDFDSEIVETHHRNKIDAPSGTALKIGEVIAKARNIDFKQHAVFTRHGVTGSRQKNDIGFAVIRGGSAVGMHEVAFMGTGETMSLKCDITDRASYATGALAAAKFLAKQQPGLYDMNDVLELS